MIAHVLPTAKGIEQHIAVKWLGHNLPQRWSQTSMQRVYIQAQNCGSRTWCADGRSIHQVKLVVRENGNVRETIQLPHDVAAGAQVTFTFPLLIGPLLLRSSEQTEWSFELAGQDDLASDALLLRIETG